MVLLKFVFVFRMPAEEQSKFRLDSCVGGTSEFIHRKAIQRYFCKSGLALLANLAKLVHCFAAYSPSSDQPLISPCNDLTYRS